MIWEKGRILVRRSHTVGEEVMKTTKQRRRYAIDLPEEAMVVLRWHVDTQLATPKQQASDLLFPSITGDFRAPCVLNKPLATWQRSSSWANTSPSARYGARSTISLAPRR